MERRIAPIAGWALALLVLVWNIHDSFRRHTLIDTDDWKTELRADAAGYYIYLPGAIHHGMRPGWLSGERLRIIGDGIREDTGRDIIITKYTYGTALIELPFFLAAELIVGWGSSDGFTPVHHRAMDVAGIVLWWSGLLLLWSALRRRWPVPGGIGLALLFLMSQGTNVFYYAFRSPAYSHIGSWALVCLALWCWAHGVSGRDARWRGALFRIACAWLILIRPLDILLVLALHALVLADDPSTRRPRWFLGQFVIGLALALPQMLYWQTAYGDPIVFSYQNEGFTNWRSPHLLTTLLAPKNGLLPYAPAFLLLPIALRAVWDRARPMAIAVLAMFLLYWYAVSSWWDPAFGCGFGQRSFVQTVPLLAMTTWYAAHQWWPRRPAIVLLLLVPFMAAAFINNMLAHIYDMCYWSTTWDPAQWLGNIRQVLH